MSRHFDPLSLANAHVQGLHPYVPGLQPDGNDWAKLNTNENPFPPSSKVVEAIQVLLSDQATSLRKYPNPTSASLREAIARHHGLEPNGVVAGNGADDILNLLMRVYGGAGHRVGMMEPSYSLYPVLAGIQDAELVKVSFDLSMQLDIDAVAASGTTIFFLTSPNAPTGVGFTTDCIEKILQSYSGILVVDETYAPFADEDATSLLADYPHLVVVRSFSKAYSLAGLRVGYALASPAVVDLLDCVRDSYNLDALAQAGAQAALEDTAYTASCIESIKALRTSMFLWYHELGWQCYPSQANFHFVEPRNAAGETGLAVAESCLAQLTQQRVLVRHFPKHRLTQGFLRVSLGTEHEMQRFRDAVDSWLKTT